MSLLLVRARARRDILGVAEYLEDESGFDLADRFLNAAQDTFSMLAKTPKVGVECGFRRPALGGLRRWPIRGFENWLVFYRPKRDGVEIVHVLHGARDLETLLDG